MELLQQLPDVNVKLESCFDTTFWLTQFIDKINNNDFILENDNFKEYSMKINISDIKYLSIYFKKSELLTLYHQRYGSLYLPSSVLKSFNKLLNMKGYEINEFRVIDVTDISKWYHSTHRFVYTIKIKFSAISIPIESLPEYSK